MATLGLPDSPGVPQSVTCDTLIAKYNDLSSVEVCRNHHLAWNVIDFLVKRLLCI